MAILKPLVVVAGQVQELGALDVLYATTQGVGTGGNVVASTQFVRNAVGAALVKDMGSGGTVTLNTSEASNPVITVTGTLTSNAILEIPANVYRLYVISNETTGAFSLSIKQASATPVAGVARSKRNLVVVNGAGAFDAQTDYESIVMTGIPLAPTMPTSADGFEVANTAFVKAAIAAAPAPAGVSIKQFYFHIADTTRIVPPGVSVLRFYAGGRGGNGGALTTTGTAYGGGGGGFSFGNLAVSPGDEVGVTFLSGVATVTLNGVTAGTANPGTNGGTAPDGLIGSPGQGGTATIAGFVTSGGAYSGGTAGGGFTSNSSRGATGGGSCGSPLGPGFGSADMATAGGSARYQATAGGGIGGIGAIGAHQTTSGGGGAGEAGTATTGGGSLAGGAARGLLDFFTDPLLTHAYAPRNGAGSFPLPGAGGTVSNGSDFGGGGGSSVSTTLAGYSGGLMAGGGGRCFVNSVIGGNGGYGGGGGGATSNAAIGGNGGPAFCFFYY